MDPEIEIAYAEGTLLVRGARAEQLAGVPECVLDGRVEAWRLPACRYRELLTCVHRLGVPYRDRARRYEELALQVHDPRPPLPHQSAALDAWRAAGRRGVVVLPTGSGKTYLGVLAIADAARSALVVTPTLDLVAQWSRQLEEAFRVPIGVVGGGEHDPRALTVTTYASAQLKVEQLGDRFGLLVFDECHHLPGPGNLMAARGSLAPYRLGLTATLERPDGEHARLAELLGPVVYQVGIEEMSGAVLAPYEVVTCEVELSEDERARYEEHREHYREFLSRSGLRLGGRDGFRAFLRAAARSAEGRRAYESFREQKRITRHAEGKLALLGELLMRHAGERAIVFTADNPTVYAIARRYLVPPLTHQTRLPERKRLLAAFAAGELPVLATSQVLNEGVDVPDASVGIVISGSGSVREHVQRLGRLLRRKAGKRAVLYEVLTQDTAERWVSDRRREHAAYRSAGAGPRESP